ncbi:MAG: rhodanese-like domain-containing protein [Deltaproteobacteria bacterium]|nr:rhodanese-like domain-containing protein [Deltaproteobacteria bacterium]
MSNRKKQEQQTAGNPATKKILLAVAVLAAVAFVWVTLQNNSGAPGEGAANVTHMGPMDAYRLFTQDKSLVVVDVRTDDEFRSGHLPGAVHLELDKLEAAAAGVLQDKNARLLVYCAVGSRSNFATNILSRMGYQRPINLLGGIVAWGRAGLPVVLN